MNPFLRYLADKKSAHRQTDRQTDRHTPMTTRPCGLRRAGKHDENAGDSHVAGDRGRVFLMLGPEVRAECSQTSSTQDSARRLRILRHGTSNSTRTGNPPHSAVHLIFRLDTLALSVIATATWLAGWLAGWLAVCHSRYCIKTTKPIRRLFGPSGRPII